MATYVIGDVQGCFEPLMRLMDRIAFDPQRDRLWFVGDLVNRGTGSLAVLRWARENAASTVLGNHELYLLARAAGLKSKKGDTLGSILTAPDADELIDWVRHLPLVYREGPHVMVHAGFLPHWSLEDAFAWAGRLESQLRQPDWSAAALSFLAPSTPDTLAAHQALAGLTRLRMLDADDRPALEFKGPPAEAPKGLRPWYHVAQAVVPDRTVYFGHWAALGFVEGPGYVALDSGCVWGGGLTAIRQEDGAVFTVPASI